MNNQCPQCGKPGMIVESGPDGKTKKKRCLQCGHFHIEDLQGRSLLQEVPNARSGLLLG
jgi:uncharacterized Zn finger protein